MNKLSSRVAFRFRFALNGWDEIRGQNREEYLPVIWEMYRSSYAKLGLHLSGPQELFKYDTWVLHTQANPRAFFLWKTTSDGVKLGLAGTDGSAEGKSAIKQHIVRVLHQPGYFAEVSHGIERLTEGAPVVCGIHVENVIHKTVHVQPDGVHYTRTLGGLGDVQKKLIGHPRGVPVADPHNPHCPLPDEDMGHVVQATENGVDPHDMAAHVGCQLDLD